MGKCGTCLNNTFIFSNLNLFFKKNLFERNSDNEIVRNRNCLSTGSPNEQLQSWGQAMWRPGHAEARPCRGQAPGTLSGDPKLATGSKELSHLLLSSQLDSKFWIVARDSELEPAFQDNILSWINVDVCIWGLPYTIQSSSK